MTTTVRFNRWPDCPECGAILYQIYESVWCSLECGYVAEWVSSTYDGTPILQRKIVN